jgi:hypothetical protein
MTRSGVFYLIFLIFLPATVFSQDTIFFVKQYLYVVKVIEIEGSKVKYRKFENLGGPLYSVDKNEILSIHYSNGTRDSFNVAAPEIGEKQLEKNELLKLIKTPNVAVYVSSNDSAAVIHAKHALQSTTSWNLVDEKSLSKFIVRFTFVSIGLGDKKGKAQFLDPKTGALILETNTVNTAFSWDVNTKRGVINKIVNNEIRKLLTE